MPLFVLGFVACVAVRSTGVVPADVLGDSQVQVAALAAALFGMGAGVKVRSLLTRSGPVLAVAAASTVFVAGLALAGVLLLGISHAEVPLVDSEGDLSVSGSSPGAARGGRAPGRRDVRAPHVVGRHVQHRPTGGREPVQPRTVAQEGRPLAVPEPVVLDRDLQVGVGEVDPADESLVVEHAELRDRRGQAGPAEEQPQPALRGDSASPSASAATRRA